MSRIGRKVIVVPAGVDVTLGDNNFVTVKGPKGTLTQQLSAAMTITREGNDITVSRPNDEKENRALHGLTRTLLNNMIIGVTAGYSKTLEIVGVWPQVNSRLSQERIPHSSRRRQTYMSPHHPFEVLVPCIQA